MIIPNQISALAPWMAAFGVAPDTVIATPFGDRRADELTVGDQVKTRLHGTQPIVAAHQSVGAAAARNHFPIRIAKGALGFGLPRADLILGPQHRVLYEHIRVPLLFGTDAVLIRAKSLVVSHDTIVVSETAAPATYVQFSLPKHDIVFANGLPIESTHTDGECDLEFMTVRSWELLAAVA